MLPDYSESTEQYVRVFIPRQKADTDFIRILLDTERTINRSLPTGALLILSLLWRQRSCDMDTLMKSSMMTPNRFEGHLTALKELGLIDVDDTRKFVRFKATDEKSSSSTELVGGRFNQKVRAKLKGILLSTLILKGKMSMGDIIELLNISRPQASKLMKEMIEEEKVALEGRGRAAVYVPLK